MLVNICLIIMLVLSLIFLNLLLIEKYKLKAGKKSIFFTSSNEKNNQK